MGRMQGDAGLKGATEFLQGGGDAGAMLRTFDWTAAGFGSAETLPQPLTTLIGVMLAARQPMFLAWGPERTLFYNDDYAPMLADRHPRAMGRPFFEVWPEVRDVLAPLFDGVLAGTPVHMDDIELQLDRPGRPREAHFAFSYTPERGEVVGLFCPCTETTEAVNARRATVRAAERQRLFLQQMPGFAGVVTGPDHVYEFVNDAYVAISGPREFVGRPVREVFPELAGQGFYELLDDVYATGRVFTARAMPLHLAGETDRRFIDLVYQPIRDENGAVSGIFVGGYDVTEAIRLERHRAALLELHDRVRDVAQPADLIATAAELLGRTLGAVRAGYGVFDPVAGTLRIERDWCAPGFAGTEGTHHLAEFGSHLDELRRGEVVANGDVETDPRTTATSAAFATLGVRAHLDVPVTENGETVAQVFVHADEPRQWSSDEIAFAREFAERTRAAIARRVAEQELRKSEAQFRQMAGATPQIVWITDAQGRMEFLNQRFVDYTGAQPAHWTPAEITARFIHPDDAATVRAAFASSIARGERFEIEHRIRSAAGEDRWFVAQAQPYRDPSSGLVVRWFGASTDIHDRKLAEERLRVLNADLERQVIERTQAAAEAGP